MANAYQQCGKASPHWRCPASFQGKNMSEIIALPKKIKFYKHHTKSGIYEATQIGADMDVYAQGGGFVKSYSQEEFDRQFTELHVDPTLKKGTVTADFLNGAAAIDCYSNALKWNGWGKPRFDRATAQKVISRLAIGIDIHFEGDVIHLENADFDPSIAVDSSNEPVLKFTPSIHIIDGKKIQLWEIGDGWTWDAVTFDPE